MFFLISFQNGISRRKFQDMSQLVRLEGTRSAQSAHCALQKWNSKDKTNLFAIFFWWRQPSIDALI